MAVSGSEGHSFAVRACESRTAGTPSRDFLFNAFLHVIRHNRPPLPTPDGKSLSPTGSPILVPPIDWGRHLVGHPMPGRVDSKGRPATTSQTWPTPQP